MRSDFYIIANQLLWHNWLQYIQQQHNEMAWRRGAVSASEERQARIGSEPLGGKAEETASQSQCRGKEIDMIKNVFCKGLSGCITSPLMWSLQRQAWKALGPHRGIHTPCLPLKISLIQMEGWTAPLIITCLIRAIAHSLMPKQSAYSTHSIHSHTKLRHHHRHPSSELHCPLWD